MYTASWMPGRRPGEIRTVDVYTIGAAGEKTVYEKPPAGAAAAAFSYTASEGRGISMGYGYGVEKEVADKTIRVSDGLKNELTELQDELRADALHSVVRKLIDYRARNEAEKAKKDKLQREQIEKLERDNREFRAYIERSMLDLGGEEGKQAFAAIKTELGLHSDIALLTFLVECYRGIPQVPMGAFETYIRLKQEGAAR